LKATQRKESHALALSAGIGVDYRLTGALAIWIPSLEYLRASAATVPGSGFQMTTGMVLRCRTW
jgi:hypothetical protein